MKYNLFALISAAALALLWAGFPAAGLPADTPPADSGGLTLTLLHTNDTHANYGGFTDKNTFCLQSLCEGGSAGSLRLKRLIDSLKAEYPKAVLADLGDQFQGTLFWRVHKSQAASAVLNSLGYQYFVPGNHEFDGGIQTFLTLLGDLKAQVLAANLTLAGSPPEARLLKPWSITEIDGRKIGFIGLTTPDTDPGEGFAVSAEKEALEAAVKKLTQEGVNIIVALTHVGLERDLELAAQVDGVDIVAGGHSHSLLGEGLPRSQGPYPAVVTSPSGHPVLVAAAGSLGRWLGLLNVTFDDQGIPVRWSGSPLEVTDQTLAERKAPPADPVLASLLDEMALPIQNLSGEIIGRIESSDPSPFLDPSARSCRLQECRTGDLAAQALLEYFPDTQTALINSGAIRYSLPAGEVSQADILASFPFEDFIVRTVITGAELLEVLQHSVSSFPSPSGRFLQAAGLQVTYEGRGQSPRIKEVLIGRPGGWTKLDPQASYTLAVPDYLAGGGDGYLMLKDRSWTKSDQLISEIVAAYLRKGPVRADYERRIIFNDK
jgi:5'-nucleotidase